MIGNSWDELLKDEYKKEYFINLKNFVIDEYKKKTIYPKMSEIFNAFTNLISFGWCKRDDDLILTNNNQKKKQ